MYLQDTAKLLICLLHRKVPTTLTNSIINQQGGRAKTILQSNCLETLKMTYKYDLGTQTISGASKTKQNQMTNKKKTRTTTSQNCKWA